MEKAKVIQKIKNALNKLYQENPSLFENELCERCINHQFAKYLEQEGFGERYFVDCEYNKTHLESRAGPKKVSSINGNYIDIVVTKRTGRGEGDLACFETKRWNHYHGRNKDRENLTILSRQKPSSDGSYFNYDLGFYIIFGKTREKTKIEIYQRGLAVEKLSI